MFESFWNEHFSLFFLSRIFWCFQFIYLALTVGSLLRGPWGTMVVLCYCAMQYRINNSWCRMRKNMNGNSSKSVLRSSFLMNCPKDFICLKDISQGQIYSLRRQQTSDLGRLVWKLVNAYINSLAAKLIFFFLNAVNITFGRSWPRNWSCSGSLVVRLSGSLAEILEMVPYRECSSCCLLWSV